MNGMRQGVERESCAGRWATMVELAAGRRVQPCVAPLDQFIPESLFFWVDGRRELLCWTLWVAGAAMVGWAMRPRGRAERRCSKCGYALAGLRGDVCPECGRAFFGAKAKRWRVRWKTAMWGVMLLPAGWCVRNALDVHERGWIALVPSIVLACVVEPEATSTDPMTLAEKPTGAEFELWRRLIRDERGHYEHCGNARDVISPRMPAWVRGLWLERWAAAANRRAAEDRRAGMVARVYSAQAAGPRRLARGSAGEGEAGTERDVELDAGAYAYAVHYALVRDIRPDDWRESGGEGGEIFTAPTHLVIRTDAATHERIAAWMARLDGMAMDERLAFLLRRGEYEPGWHALDALSDGP